MLDAEGEVMSYYGKIDCNTKNTNMPAPSLQRTSSAKTAQVEKCIVGSSSTVIWVGRMFPTGVRLEKRMFR